MGKYVGNIFRDLALILLSFMPILFAYGMMVYVFFNDPIFSYFAGQFVAPLATSFLVVFFGSRLKPMYKVFQALILFLMALVWAAPPTRLTDIPTLIAGRRPELNRSELRKI